MSEDLRLAGVLEKNVLGLESLGLGRWSLAFRLGQGVVLLFDRERSSTQSLGPLSYTGGVYQAMTCHANPHHAGL